MKYCISCGTAAPDEVNSCKECLGLTFQATPLENVDKSMLLNTKTGLIRMRNYINKASAHRKNQRETQAQIAAANAQVQKVAQDSQVNSISQPRFDDNCAKNFDDASVHQVSRTATTGERAAVLYVPEYILKASKAPENEVYTELKSTRTKSYVRVRNVFIILLNLMLLGSLFFNYTVGAVSLKGVEPIYSLFKLSNTFDAFKLSYTGKYAKILMYFGYAFAGFAGIAALDFLFSLMLIKTKRAARAISIFLTSLLNIAFIAIVAAVVLIFKTGNWANGIGLYAAFAVMLIKNITVFAKNKKSKGN